MATRYGSSHEARKKLFLRGVRRGWVTLGEIEEAVPKGSLSASERWLLFYSLRAAGVEIVERRREEDGASRERPPARPEV